MGTAVPIRGVSISSPKISPAKPRVPKDIVPKDPAVVSPQCSGPNAMMLRTVCLLLLLGTAAGAPLPPKGLPPKGRGAAESQPGTGDIDPPAANTPDTMFVGQGDENDPPGPTGATADEEDSQEDPEDSIMDLPDAPVPLSNAKPSKVHVADIKTDAAYNAAFAQLARKLGEGVRKQEVSMLDPSIDAKQADKEWVAMLNMNEDNIISEDELESMAFVNDENDPADRELVKRLKSFYLAKPGNKAAWEKETAEHFTDMEELADENPFDWFKFSGFFKAYLKLYDNNSDGKTTVQEMSKPLGQHKMG